MDTVNFWDVKQLEDLSQTEWESLCDGCGKCCAIKIRDDETGDVFYTDIACRLLDRVGMVAPTGIRQRRHGA
jgi:uncharacterized cysteine cluster protein YcgN (CxxCxxCC family)